MLTGGEALCIEVGNGGGVGGDCWILVEVVVVLVVTVVVWW